MRHWLPLCWFNDAVREENLIGSKKPCLPQICTILTIPEETLAWPVILAMKCVSIVPHQATNPTGWSIIGYNRFNWCPVGLNKTI